MLNILTKYALSFLKHRKSELMNVLSCHPFVTSNKEIILTSTTKHSSFLENMQFLPLRIHVHLSTHSSSLCNTNETGEQMGFLHTDNQIVPSTGAWHAVTVAVL